VLTVEVKVGFKAQEDTVQTPGSQWRKRGHLRLDSLSFEPDFQFSFSRYDGKNIPMDSKTGEKIEKRVFSSSEHVSVIG
jgi:hypothetical protein